MNSGLDLSSLIGRVEAATGPDRELDYRIDMALKPESWIQFAGRSLTTEHLQDIIRVNDSHSNGIGWYTSSLDAALALVERVLPGWGWEAVRPLGIGGYAKVFDGAGREFDRTGEIGGLSEWLDAGPCHSPTPALALICALLRAIQARSLRHNARDGAETKTNGPSDV